MKMTRQSAVLEHSLPHQSFHPAWAGGGGDFEEGDRLNDILEVLTDKFRSKNHTYRLHNSSGVLILIVMEVDLLHMLCHTMILDHVATSKTVVPPWRLRLGSHDTAADC